MNIELSSKTIFWDSRSEWTELRDDGTVYYAGVTLPTLKVLQHMAVAIAKGRLSYIRLQIEERDPGIVRDIWKDAVHWGDHTYGNPDYTLELTSKLDHYGTSGWWIVAREPLTDGLFSSGRYMSPNEALAWFIATCWEYHVEWMSEQLEVVGGLA